MFLRTSYGQKRPRAPAYIHPWVVEAEKRSRKYRVNPARPNVRSVEGGRLRDIRDSNPSMLRAGDAVAVRFAVSYLETEKDYGPQFMLSDIIRLASALTVSSLPPPQAARERAAPATRIRART